MILSKPRCWVCQTNNSKVLLYVQRIKVNYVQRIKGNVMVMTQLRISIEEEKLSNKFKVDMYNNWNENTPRRFY